MSYLLDALRRKRMQPCSGPLQTANAQCLVQSEQEERGDEQHRADNLKPKMVRQHSYQARQQ